METRTGLFVLVCLLASPTAVPSDEPTVDQILKSASSRNLAKRVNAAADLYWESDFDLGQIEEIAEWIYSEEDP